MDCGDGSSSSPSGAQLVVEELRKELEHERQLRRRAEAASRALALELAEERQERTRLAEELEEAARAGREMEEERRMLQIAGLWREERVQIKLLEAEVAMEEKLRQMMVDATASDGQRQQEATKVKVNDCKSQCRGQAKKEVENPHIRRGIRGHVEFPKVVKTAATTQHKSGGGSDGGGWKGAISSETNLECQRAQLRVLMRHKNVNGGAVGTSINFVT